VNADHEHMSAKTALADPISDYLDGLERVVASCDTANAASHTFLEDLEQSNPTLLGKLLSARKAFMTDSDKEKASPYLPIGYFRNFSVEDRLVLFALSFEVSDRLHERRMSVRLEPYNKEHALFKAAPDLWNHVRVSGERPADLINTAALEFVSGTEFVKFGRCFAELDYGLNPGLVSWIRQRFLNESIVEDAALEWFGELGYAVGHGPHLAPGEPAAERDSFSEVVLVGRLREAIRRLNPAIPEEAREEALRKVLRVGTPSLTQTNRAFHRMLRDGVPVEYPRPDGSIAGDHVRLVDFGDVRANDWLAVNQFTVIEGQHNRRPDIVVFVNGLPLGLIELKNAADEDATIWSAYAQLQTYKAEIASLLHYNAALVVSDGLAGAHGLRDGEPGVVQGLAHD
jgi:hypothetical protein